MACVYSSVKQAMQDLIAPQLESLKGEIGALRVELGGFRNELHTQVGGLRNELRTEIASVRSEMGSPGASCAPRSGLSTRRLRRTSRAWTSV